MGIFDSLKGTSRVTFDQREEQLIEERAVVFHDPRRHHLVEGGEGVPGRASPTSNGRLNRRIGQVELGVGGDVVEQRG